MAVVSQSFSATLLCLSVLFLQTDVCSALITEENVVQTLHNSNSIETMSLVFVAGNNSELTKLVLSPNCSTSFQTFSASLTNFTRCSIQFARPIQLCMECRKTYLKAVNSYKNMKQQDVECQEYYFGSDQLGVIDFMYSTVVSMWEKASCQNCYSHYNETEVFFQASADYMRCIQSTNASSVSNNTCDKCHSSYGNLSESFQKFVQWQKVSDEKICMDIVDAMNRSRRLWQEYDCAVVFGTDIGFPNVLTALTVGATPLMFYILAKNVSRLEDVRIVRPKRKFASGVVPQPQQEQ